MKDLVALLPMQDEVVVIGLTGAQLIEALENGVSTFPKTEGRFPCVAGVKFQFNSQKPPGERVVRDTITVDGEALSLEKEYRVATKLYLAQGKDGYDVFLKGRTIIGDSEASILPTIIRNRFLLMKVVDAFQSYQSSPSSAENLILSFLKNRKRRMMKKAPTEDDSETSSDEGVDDNECLEVKAEVDGRIERVG